jgi:ketosteroid isomerase-like protein
MSQENVELLYRAYDAFNRRDLDAFLALMDPEVELTTRIIELEGDPYYRGHDGIREWWRTLLGIFPDFSGEVLEVRDLRDSLIVRVRVRGHGVEGDVVAELRKRRRSPRSRRAVGVAVASSSTRL